MSTADRAYLDQLGGFFATHGMPPVAGRLMAHLLICEPSEQRADELAAAVGASRASVSVMTRLLVQLGLIDRRSATGKTLVYRLHPDAWTRLLEDDLKSATRLREIAQAGLQLLGKRPPRARARLQRMRGFYQFLEDETAASLGRWRRRAHR